MRRALILDFDGLIMDTETPWFVAWRAIYARCGQELTREDWFHAIGHIANFDPKAELERRLGRAPDWGPLEEERARIDRALRVDQRALPGVERLLREGRERGYAIGVASNSDAAWVEKGLAQAGVRDFIEVVVAWDGSFQPKPHPDPYAVALRRLGAEPEGSWAFEDSHPGLASAKAAGLAVAVVPNSFTRGMEFPGADRVLGSLEDFAWPTDPCRCPR